MRTEFVMVVNSLKSALVLAWNETCWEDIKNCSDRPDDWDSRWTEKIEPGFYKCSAEYITELDPETGDVYDVKYEDISIDPITAEEAGYEMLEQKDYREPFKSR